MKKLVIWDCDNTLWGGILLENEAVTTYPEIIQFIRETRERGVAHSIASYGNKALVDKALERFGISDLFIYPQVDMADVRSKPQMLQTIKDEFDLSKWSDIVFVDDDPSNLYECAAVFPGLEVFAPWDIEALSHSSVFTKPRYTEEDVLRVRRYEQESFRKVAAQAYPGDKVEFLRWCQISVDFSECKTQDVERVADLALRANRMSALSKSYTREEIESLREFITVVKVSDRYGDYGLSAFYLLEPTQDGTGSEIEALVVSCRLQGKGIGTSILTHIMMHMHQMYDFRSAFWKETDYNTSFYDLYKFSGFDVTRHVDRIVTAYLDRRPSELAYPVWITVK